MQVTFGSFDYHWLLNESSSVLQSQTKSKKPDSNYMAGALAGLSSALAQCQVIMRVVRHHAIHWRPISPPFYCLYCMRLQWA